MNGKTCVMRARLRRLPILIAACGVLGLAGTVAGTEYHWNPGSAYFLYNDLLNWTPSPGPGFDDTAIFDLPGSHEVSFETQSMQADHFFVWDGDFTFELTGNTYTVNHDGSQIGGRSSLTLIRGTVAGASIGVALNYSDLGSTLTVSTDASLNMSGLLKVANFGRGTLIVQNGGDVSCGTLRLADADAGYATATVSGASATLRSTGAFYLGNAGNASLEITNGGVASSTTFAAVAFTSTSESSLTVSGAGSLFDAHLTLDIGYGGLGLATVSSGGRIATASTLSLGMQTSGVGSLTVTGSGSAVASAGQIMVGWEGSGTFNVLSGATASSAGASLAFFGAASRGTASVDGAGSRWDVGGTLTVGDAGTATLDVSNGGRVNASTLNLGISSGSHGTMTVTGNGSTVSASNINVAQAAGSNGTIMVTGAGTRLNGDSSLVLGVSGFGILKALDGGVIDIHGISTVGGNSGGVGSAEVTGIGSTWNSNGLNIGSASSHNGSVTVGDGGTLNVNGPLNLNDPAGVFDGLLTIKTGATVNANAGFTRRGILVFLGGLMQVNSGAFDWGAFTSTMTITGGDASDLPTLRLAGNVTTSNITNFTIGSGGTRGALEVRGGADVTTLANSSMGVGGGSGTLLVDGAGSTFGAGGIILGTSSGGSALATVSNGGSVSITNTTLGSVAGTSGTINVSGAGSNWSGGSPFEIGAVGRGTLTLNAGSIASGGAVYVGRSTGGIGAITIDGPGSKFTATGVMEIGRTGTGSVTITNGGILESPSTTAFIGSLTAGTGTVTISGAGSAWNAQSIAMGTASSGSATLSVLNGASVTAPNSFSMSEPVGAATTTLILDGGTMTTGQFSRDGNFDFRDGILDVHGGSFNSGPTNAPLVLNGSAPGKVPQLRLTGGASTLYITDLTIGLNRAASVYVEYGSSTSSANTYIGADPGSNGTATVEGLMATALVLSVGGDTTAGGAGTLLIQEGGAVNTQTLNLFPQGTVYLNNGSIIMNSFNPFGGTFDFAQGTVKFSPAATTLTSPMIDKLLGFTHTLGGGRTLMGNANVTVGTNITVDGGSLESDTGNIIVSASNILRIVSGRAVANQRVTNAAGAIISLDGGTLSAGVDITNNGELQVHSGTALVSAPSLINSGLVMGSGRIGAPLNNQATGEVRATGTDRLIFTNTVSNAGLINLLNGGTVEFQGALTNASGGRISGRGVVVARGGMSNDGQIAFSGGMSDFFGPLTNTGAGSRVIVTGAGMATFYDTITHNAGAEIRVSTGSAAVFLGAVNGVGTFSGAGAKYFEGGGSAVGPIATPGSSVVAEAASLSATYIREDSLTVNGLVTINTSGGASHLNHLAIAGATDNWDGVLDLKNNSLVLEGGSLAVITNQIKGGLYQGTGITSSAPGSPFRLGSMSNAGTIYSSFQGISGLDGDEVLVRYTRIGDLNLDGTVTISDFIDLASHFGASSATWQMGDVNYDGSVTISDFIDLSSNFGQSVSGIAAPISDEDQRALDAFADANVPEPALLLVAMGGVLTLRRRARSF